MDNENNYSSFDVTLAVLNYNGFNNLPDLFNSIAKLDQPPGELIMVDDGSDDGSPEWVEENVRDCVVFRMNKNTKILNKVRNHALSKSQKPLVMIIDNDVALMPDCLVRLLEVKNKHKEAGACMTRAVYWDDPNKIYQDGQILHYVGASPSTNRDKYIDQVDNQERISIGWGVQLICKKRASSVDFFNEAYLLGWGDDGEFNHKLNLSGFPCFHVPKAVVLHKRNVASERFMEAVVNRWRFIIEMYELKTLLLALPGLLLYEAALIGFLILKKAPKEYLVGMHMFIKDIPGIIKSRKAIQNKRKVGDRSLMGAGDIFVYTDYVDSRFLVAAFKVLNTTLNFYWRIIHKFL